jgi:asparagine synthase (glutamine-hydrolysing)
MTGYVTGSDTLIQGLKKLQSGESMIVNRPNNSVNISRYYRYYSAGDESRSDDDWVDELDVIMNNITQRMIDRAEERPIRVPLSAGLDSRVLVCKLHEAGYNDLEVFSYGPPGNWEARGAQTIAKRLDIPWRSVVINRKEAHQMFWSSEREKYWNFADGLSALPNFQEYYPISKLHSMGVLPENSILINGQSGDFITGGHVPKTLIQSDANVRTLLDIIIEKHYALWTNLMTIDRLERVEEKILKLLGVSIDTELTAEELVSLYERWECEERQVKWVIHGQRVYDFFGYDWQLPLWDIELARFYQRVPIHLKLDQYLYRSWLERWNYKGLFLDFNPSVWRWPGVSLAVVPLAKGVEMLLGGRAKRGWYKMFYYFGHSSDHYAPYSYSEYFQARNLIRNSTSLNGRVWARENYLPRELVDLGQ